MTSKITKKLSYAYPTSPDADKYNKGRGCWIITVSDRKEPIDVYDDSEKASAFEYFRDIDLEVDKWSTKIGIIENEK